MYVLIPSLVHRYFAGNLGLVFYLTQLLLSLGGFLERVLVYCL